MSVPDFNREAVQKLLIQNAHYAAGNGLDFLADAIRDPSLCESCLIQAKIKLTRAIAYIDEAQVSL